MRLLKIFVILLSIVITSSVFPPTKKDARCDEWARQGKPSDFVGFRDIADSCLCDCMSNPSYMWTDCHTSCLEMAKDTEEDCEIWASQGECVKDPQFINVHCPISCGKALAWNPWTRHASGITGELPYFPAFESRLNKCMNPSDLVGSAEMISTQIIVYMWGGGRMTSALSSSSPTEYLGLFGVSEAILYALALYNLNSIYAIDRLSSIPYPTLTVMETIENARLRYERDRNNLQNINDVIEKGYTADVLLTKVPVWQNLLHIASGDANVILTEYQKIFPPSAANFAACPHPRGPSILEIVKFMPELANPRTLSPVSVNVRLSNGRIMPRLAFGTWQLPLPDCELTVLTAIRQGYRHIDTAEAFRNEFCVGWAVIHAIKEGTVTREDMFITTKLSDEGNGGYTAVKRLVSRQLDKLKTTYIDLYMLHSPMTGRNKQMETWRALEELVDQGTIRSLGVSNFDSKSLSQLLQYARIKPVVLQNKVDIYHVGKQLDRHGDDIISFAQDNGLFVVGYSPLSAYPFALRPIEDPIIKYIAASKGASPTQIILRWMLQHGFGAVTRSMNPDHMTENLNALMLPPLTMQDMHMIDTIQFLSESPITRAFPIYPTMSDRREL